MQLQHWAWDRVDCEKLLLRCRLLGSARHLGAHGGGEGRGYIMAAARPPTVCYIGAGNQTRTTGSQHKTRGKHRIIEHNQSDAILALTNWIRQKTDSA